MTVSLVQVRAQNGEYVAQIGSGSLATTAYCKVSAGAAARIAFARRVGLYPHTRANIAAIKVARVAVSAASGTELFLCELVDAGTPERSAA
ncbi:MAG TPA: hypothetical protein VK163_06100 [Opitutaceae bacterium]|nr:hypothetical protein [Opitutaceae bacterium]